ncbi:MAG: hypothetical protein Fur0025_22160 [Oscillatoriaceae cyanobacterium]
MSIFEIGAFNGSYSYADGVTSPEPTDIYQLPLLEPGNLRLSLGGLSAPVAVEVWDKETLLRTVEIDANNPEAINLYDLSPGNYSLEVARTNKNTGYTLNIDTLTGQQADSGFFVSDEESMTVDILSGDNTQLEIAVVNLEGMEEFNPGSEAYIKEAARRSLSNSSLGRVLVSGNGSQTELSAVFPWESEITGNFDGSPSRYVETFTAQPGDKFALMAVKNNTIQDVFDNPKVNGSNSPVFSLDDAGGVGGFGISQSELANGTIFTIDKNGNFQETVIYIPKPEPEPTPPVTEPTPPVTEQPTPPVMEEPTSPVVEQPTPPVVEEPLPPVMEEPLPPVTEQPLPPVTEQPTPPVMEQPTPPVMEQPTPPVTEQPTPPVMEEPTSPVVGEPTSPVVGEPLPPVMEEPTSPVTEQPTPPVVDVGGNNIPPKGLDITVQMDGVGNPVAIAGTVSDRNGGSDIARVEFLLHTTGESWTALGTTSSFTVDAANSEQVSFNYALTANLAAGSYKVKAIAYDRAGKSSNASLTDLDIIDLPTPPGPTPPPGPGLPPTVPNSSPEALNFTVLPIYTNGETLSFAGGKVQDAEGTDDIDKIQFSLRTVDGEWVEAGEAQSLTTDGDGVTRFDFTYDLTDLVPGSYQLQAVAYDKAGNQSNVEERNFAIITDPGGEGLSDELRVDMAGAANLDRYNREDLEATKQWVVWVTPGESATDLAQSLGAVNLGETGQIPNTYIWEFPDKPGQPNSPESIASSLAALPGVEFAYPDVPVPLKLMSTSFDDGYKSRQWNLQSGVNPGAPSSIAEAWEIINPRTGLPVRGRGAVIAIVDDGLDYNHSELVNRYNSSLSWDFSDGDANPFPQSNRQFKANVSDYEIDLNKVRFNLPVTLTGLVTNVTLNLELQGKAKNQLDGLKFKLYSPSDRAKDPFDWLSYAGLWWRYPGWHDFTRGKSTKIEPKGSKKGGESFSREDSFDDIYAAGTWQLEVTLPSDKSHQAENIAKNLINSWSLQVETANPHGTAVAGVAAAGGNLLYGVAPASQLAALRLIGTVDPVTATYDAPGSTIAKVLFQAKTAPGGVNRNNEIDIFNSSWGPEYMRQFPLAIAALESGFKLGRNGLGNIYIFSAGNDGAEIGHINYNNLTNSRGAIAVGAITRDGNFAEYSTQAPFVVAYSDNATNDPNYEITTTAIDQDITDFGGTSAAAPFVSGVTALILEVNPDLTARDVQHILAETAYQNDPTHSGWRVNGGGYHVNPQYGFGAVDPVAAVNAAMNWTPVAEEVKVTGGQKLKNVLSDIKDNQTVTDKIAIAEDITVEHAEVIVDIDHPDWKDLTFILKSPDGTASTLMHSIPNDPYGIGKTYTVNPASNSWTFTSTQHWGESSLGAWTLEVRDEKGNQVEGNWNGWQLNLYGTKPTVNVTATQPDATENGTPGEFTISRTGNTKNPLTVSYAVDGTATNGTDYQQLAETVVIPAGQSSVKVTVMPVTDTLVDEDDETVALTLTDGNNYDLGSNLTDTVTIANYAIPLNHWNAAFINRTADNVRDRSTYDFSNPVATLDLGYQSSNGKISLDQNWDINSPAPGVQGDDFAMQTWTRTTFEAGKLYKIVTQSDDGVWFRLKNVQTGEWVGDSVVLGDDGADWRDRNVDDPPRTIFFKVPETGEYDFYVDYYDLTAEAVVDFTVEEAQYFAEPVNPVTEWNSTFYWWDRKLGPQPAGDFFANGGDPSNAIGTVNLGSDTRSDGKKGITAEWGDRAALDDVRLPDNNFAIRSYTEENLEAGRQYRMQVRADDGFQLLAKNKATNEIVYITPQNQWQQAYGSHQVIDFTVPTDGTYEIYFDTYETAIDAYFDLFWEPGNSNSGGLTGTIIGIAL